MFSGTYFGTTTTGGGSVSTVATALKDIREPTGQLPPAKIARIYEAPTFYEDKVYMCDTAGEAFTAIDALALGGKGPADFWQKTDDLPTGGGMSEADLQLIFARKYNSIIDPKDTVYNATHLNGKADTEFTTELSLENKLWWDGTTGYWTTDNVNRFKGRPITDFALRYVAGPDENLHTVYNTTHLDMIPASEYARKSDLTGGQDLSLYAKKDDGTPETQDTVANATYLGWYPADAYARKTEVGTSTAKKWNAITNYEGSVARHTIPFGGAEDRIGFTQEPYDPVDPDRPFKARDLVVYWDVTTPLTTLQANLADPLRMPDGNPRVKTPDNVAFELVNPKDIPLEILIYEGGSFIAKVKHNTGTSQTPNNRDYVRIPPGGWVTFKWFNRQDDYKWVVFGDLV